MEENTEIKKAMNELEELSEDYELRRIAELKEKTIRDENHIKVRFTEDGKKEGKKEIAKNMKNKKLPIELIMELTGLSKEEIEEL